MSMHRKCVIAVFYVVYVWTYSSNDSGDDFLIPVPWKHQGKRNSERQGQRHSEEQGQRHSEEAEA